MSQISLPALSKKCGLSRRHLQRMVADGRIPGATRTAGGHWRVKNDAALAGWLAAMGFAKVERNCLGRDKVATFFNAAVVFEQKLDAATLSVTTQKDALSVFQLRDYVAAVEKKISAALAKIDARLNAEATAAARESARRSSSLNG